MDKKANKTIAKERKKIPANPCTILKSQATLIQNQIQVSSNCLILTTVFIFSCLDFISEERRKQEINFYNLNSLEGFKRPNCFTY